MANGSVEVLGLSDFVRDLRDVDDKYPKQVARANFDLATYLTIESKRTAAALGGVANKAAGSLRPSRAARFSAISGGGPRYPYFYGAEFGALRYRQFKVWRGNQWRGWAGGPGYFLQPTIRLKSAAGLEKYMERLDQIMAEAFPE